MPWPCPSTIRTTSASGRTSPNSPPARPEGRWPTPPSELQITSPPRSWPLRMARPDIPTPAPWIGGPSESSCTNASWATHPSTPRILSPPAARSSAGDSAWKFPLKPRPISPRSASTSSPASSPGRNLASAPTRTAPPNSSMASPRSSSTPGSLRSILTTSRRGRALSSLPVAPSSPSFWSSSKRAQNPTLASISSLPALLKTSTRSRTLDPTSTPLAERTGLARTVSTNSTTTTTDASASLVFLSQMLS
mmetsp:Transcript_27869/g.65430  ORF Transcript_27869/g.65430 Transcript_27869/m.65430 type:complete len:250 (-) Transcript_27869:236-985(-)